MEVIIQDQNWQFANTDLGVEQLFEKLDALLSEHQLHIDQMTIDGVVIYEEYKEKIMQQLTEVVRIEVNVVTIEQYMYQLMDSSYSYCAQAVKQLPELSTQFYQTPTKQSWEQFQALLEGITWLTQLIGLLEEIKLDTERLSALSGIGRELNQILLELLPAMENQDHTSIGDLLQYEVLPLMEKLEQEISLTLSEAGEGR